MKKRLGFFLMLIILFLSCIGSSRKQEFSYPYIEIPEYKSKDYYNLLSDKKSEVVYNSICNLINNYSALSSVYYDESSDKTSEEYLLSKNIYEKIKNLTVKFYENIRKAFLL